jgi:hypothetical protein
MAGRRAWTTGAAAVALLAPFVSCSDDDGGSGGGSTTSTSPAVAVTEPPESTPLDPDAEEALASQVAENPDCEVLDPRACLLPFPSDHFTEPDEGTDTARRLAVPESAMPVNSSGVAIDPAAWAGNDGFSPGTPMLAHLPTVDLEASRAPTIGHIERSVEEGSPVVVVDLETGERVPVWAELDSTATEDEQRLLIVRVARNLAEGHRHAVALRGLVDDEGEPIEPPVGFRAYRDNLATSITEVEARREEMESLFAALDEVGVARDDLVLAWQFTVASERNLSERLLAMRDDALFDHGDDGAPAFAVTEVVEAPADELDEGIARVVRGTFTVPSYLSGDGQPGSRLHDTDGDWIPERNGELQAPFACQIPASALADPAGGVVYGHGLLGSHGEVESGHVARTADRANLVYCATDWWGMAEADLPNAVAILGDLGRFATLADRTQQGILNTVLLGRLLRSPQGFAADPAFAGDPPFAGERSAVLDGEVYFDGNSQGGIMGGAATAVSTEWTKAVLGVPGMNYSTLLRRSVDFVGAAEGDVGFEDVLVPAYPDPVDQNLAYGLIQVLWDRGETNGYAAHLTDDPLEGTPEHTVVLHVAFGDHQVATVTAEVMARTAGIGLRWPALAEGRHPDAEPWFGLDRVDSFPTQRSLLVYWDSGTLPPPPGNIAVVESQPWLEACAAALDTVPCLDSHEDPRRQQAAIAQKAELFRPDGEIIDTCGGTPCQAIPRSQLDG